MIVREKEDGSAVVKFDNSKSLTFSALEWTMTMQLFDHLNSETEGSSSNVMKLKEANDYLQEKIRDYDLNKIWSEIQLEQGENLQKSDPIK